MVDLHCHILPQLDDGPQNLEESLQMCRIASLDGIKKIVATPHTLNGVYYNAGQTIREAVNQLNQALKKENIKITVFSGADIHINPDIIKELSEDIGLTINSGGRYFMLELPSQVVPAQTKELIFSLLIEGFIPIITHPERNKAIQEDINCLYTLVHLGALAQVTSTSLLGGFGPEALDCAKKILAHKLVQIIASDAHSADKRPPKLSEAVKVASNIVGEDFAQDLVTSIPEKIIANEILNLPSPLKSETTERRFFFKR
jgi:protein-tyrosine phosphatase